MKKKKKKTKSHRLTGREILSWTIATPPPDDPDCFKINSAFANSPMPAPPSPQSTSAFKEVEDSTSSIENCLCQMPAPPPRESAPPPKPSMVLPRSGTVHLGASTNIADLRGKRVTKTQIQVTRCESKESRN
jgi:hypothetical protein